MLALNKKGQDAIEALIAAPIIVLILVVSYALLSPIGAVLFEVLDDANSDVITQVATIKVLVSLIGLVLGIMAFVAIINKFRRPRLPQQFA